jgi:hypothetical protein
MAKWDKWFEEKGFNLYDGENKSPVARNLEKLLTDREGALESFMQEPNEELSERLHSIINSIVALCNQYKIKFDNKVVVERYLNIVTHTLKENAMKTKKNTAKKETVKQEVVTKKTNKPEPVKKQEAKAATKPKKAEKTPGKAPASPAPEPQKQEAAKQPVEFKTPCGGLFDTDPNSSCFGMCKDESPEDFELCMNHFKSTMEQKTSRRRTAARANNQSKVAGTKKAPKRYDRIGDGLGTSAHMINILLLEGATIEEMMEIVPTERTRIMGHLSGLKTGNGHRAPKTVIKDPTDKRYYLEVEEGEPCTYFTIC